MLESLLLEAEPKTRLAIGQHLIAFGRKLIADLEREEEINADVARRRIVIDRCKQLAPLVTRLMFHGQSRGDALERVARRFNLEAPQLGAWWHRLEGPRAITAMRNRLIVRLAARGWKNARIAAELGVTHQTVWQKVRIAVRRGELTVFNSTVTGFGERSHG